MSRGNRACRTHQVVRVVLVDFGERHDTRTNGQHYTAADRLRPTNQVSAWKAGRGSRPTSSYSILARMSGVSTRMLRLYEETAPVEIQLWQTVILRSDLPAHITQIDACVHATCYRSISYTAVTTRLSQGIARRNNLPFQCQFKGSISTVQPLSECFWIFEVAPATASFQLKPLGPVGSTSSTSFLLGFHIKTMDLKYTGFAI